TVVAAEPSASPTPSESASPTASPSPTQTPDESGEPTASATPTDNGNQNDRDDLAQTGFSTSWIGMAAGGIVLLGILLLLVRRFG
ncbi:LPXTG cell wall anchor domain-containing protein, partial [Mycobacterium tuberculosis]